MIDDIEWMTHRGWRLFPCREGGKEPLVRWKNAASSNLAAIHGWIARFPKCNWGVATGFESGVFVCDVDGTTGRDSLARLETQFGALPATLTSLTGREDGGKHLWFRWPPKGQVACSAGQIGNGLDIRGAGGYVIVPPSVHETGRAYRWEEPEQPIAGAPSWLLDQLTAKAARAEKTEIEVPTFSVGQRNNSLARYAGTLRRKGANLPEIERKLLEANAESPVPLGEDEVRKIAKSIARYPIGSPDPLTLAWQATQEEYYVTREDMFLALCWNLQRARPDQYIALPIKRIGELLGVHWTTVSRYRDSAQKSGILVQLEPYVKGKLAGKYRMDCSTEAPLTMLTRDMHGKPLRR